MSIRVIRAALACLVVLLAARCFEFQLDSQDHDGATTPLKRIDPRGDDERRRDKMRLASRTAELLKQAFGRISPSTRGRAGFSLGSSYKNERSSPIRAGLSK